MTMYQTCQRKSRKLEQKVCPSKTDGGRQKVKALEAEYEASLRKKICTQSLKTINRFHGKYPTIPHEEEPLLKRNSDYEIELQQFISDSFEAWGGIQRRSTRSALVYGQSN
jgi:hypothetical protein